MATVAEVVSDLGHGPVVVLLHGVGVGPETLATVGGLSPTGPRAVVVRRPAAGDRGGPAPTRPRRWPTAVDRHTGGEGSSWRA